jgi:hypothetical protein
MIVVLTSGSFVVFQSPVLRGLHLLGSCTFWNLVRDFELLWKYFRISARISNFVCGNCNSLRRSVAKSGRAVDIAPMPFENSQRGWGLEGVTGTELKSSLLSEKTPSDIIVSCKSGYIYPLPYSVSPLPPFFMPASSPTSCTLIRNMILIRVLF